MIIGVKSWRIPDLKIRSTTEPDRPDVLSIHRLAFGQDEEADLVDAILDDPGARPLVSLLAFDEDRPVGHILFSAARLTETEIACSASILAPLAIVPDAQKRGIGGALIKAGLDALSKSATDLVFVLGHPDYYPRSGFEPAGKLGLQAPFPIPEKHADAWMVQALRPGLLGTIHGKLVCCDALNRPELWRE